MGKESIDTIERYEQGDEQNSINQPHHAPPRRNHMY